MKFPNQLKAGYIEYCTKVSDKKKVSYQLFCHINEEFHKKISDMIIKDGFIFKLPFKLGEIRIKKFKRKRLLNEDGTLKKEKLKVDWYKTWELRYKKFPGKSRTDIVNLLRGKDINNKFFVYHFNEHTNEWICRWYWDKYLSWFTNQTIYKFKPTKFNRLELAKAILNNNNLVQKYIDNCYSYN